MVMESQVGDLRGTEVEEGGNRAADNPVIACGLLFRG